MENSNLVYGVKDRPNFGKVLVFALQQLLAILAATIAVPAIINNGFIFTGEDAMSQSAALFGAGVGTIIYLLFTRFKSPVFLGSSFAFLGSMFAAFAGAVSVNVGYLGLIIGAILAGLVYVVLAMIVKACGTRWINKIMPAVVIGPTVAIIGLSLAGNAIGDLNGNIGGAGYEWVNAACLFCGLVTLFATICCSIFGKKMLKMIPFIIGIAAGYIAATVITAIAHFGKFESLNLIHFEAFKNMQWYPNLVCIKAFGAFKDITSVGQFFTYFWTIFIGYVPVAFVVFAEHIADHKNLSSIINQDLLTDPGLDNTLLGDGIGSMAGAFFGGCPNTTYGESIGCVAISGNASIITIFVTAIMAIIASFIAPFTTLLATIPACVMGGVCIALYGFIAVSGLKMLQGVDLGDNRNLFVVSVILICGVGGLCVTFKVNATQSIQLTEIACALILGIITNLICSIGRKEKAVSVIDNGVDVDELEASLQAELEEEVAEEETEEDDSEELTLKDLDILKEQGLISDEEYEEKKKNLK